MGEGISNTGKHMKEPREPKEMHFELVNRRDGWSGQFETMYAALNKADVRGMKSYQLFELGRDGTRVLRFEAST
jgi:hypothetical protein